MVREENGLSQVLNKRICKLMQANTQNKKDGIQFT